MQARVPAIRDVVLVGAGHAHAIALRNFGMDPIPGVRLTLVTRRVHTPYSGMLPGLIARHYTFEQTHIDTRPLCRFANAQLHVVEATDIDLEGQRLLCADGREVRYDVLSLDIGSTPSGANVPGVGEHAVPVKPIDGFLEHFAAARDRIRESGARVRIAVVGAGAGGVELVMALAHRLRSDSVADGLDPARLEFTVLTSGDCILPAFSASARGRLERILNEQGISARTGMLVEGVSNDHVHIRNAAPLAFDEVFWTTEASAAPWLAGTGLDLDEHGFVRVDPTLQSTSHEGVFAAGDIASVAGYALPKAGVYAVRQGTVLASNIRRAIAGQTLSDYRPQQEALYLVSTGSRYAVGSGNGLSVEGRWVWWWKNWIDSRFMAQFKNLGASPSSGAGEDGSRLDNERATVSDPR